jgi:hypothetical protein
MPSGFTDGCDEGYVESSATSDVTLSMLNDLDGYQQLTVTLCVPDSEWIRSSVVNSITPYLERRSSPIDAATPLLAAVLLAQMVLIALQIRKSKR